MSISRPVTGRYGLCTVRWKFSCCIRSSSSFKIISEAFSRSPLMLATNCCIEMLNSSTLHAKYTHVTLWGEQNSPMEHSAMNRAQNGTSCLCAKLKHHAMKAYGGIEVNLHILLSLAGTRLRWVLSFTPIPSLFLQGRSWYSPSRSGCYAAPTGNQTPIPGLFNPQPRQYSDGATWAHIIQHDINYNYNNMMEQLDVWVLIVCDNYRLLLAITAPLWMLAVSLGTKVANTEC